MAGADQTSDPHAIIRAMDRCSQMLQGICQQWPVVNPHRIAFDRLSGEVKRLIEENLLASPSSAQPNDVLMFDPATAGSSINQTTDLSFGTYRWT